MNKMSDNLKYALLKEIFRVAIIGPLGFLADSSKDVGEDDETPEEDDKTLKKFILDMLVKYNKDQTLAYNPEVVRDEIAKRKELEKNTFINRLDKIQDDEHRKIEKQIQRLGAKSSNNDWSARGTTFGEIYKQDTEINTYAEMAGAMDGQNDEEDGYMGVGQVFDGNGDD
jgi:hypothetical protein